MAGTSKLIGSSNPVTAQAWARIVFADALRESFYGKFMGRGNDGRVNENDPGALVVVMNELGKEAGDTITAQLRVLPQGRGVGEGETLEGNEEAMDFRSDSIRIGQLRHAMRFENKMGQQRVSWSLRNQAKDALKDWLKERLDNVFFSQLASDETQTDNVFTGNNGITAPTYNYFVDSANNSTATEVVSGTDALTLATLRAMAARARELRFRPVRTPKGDLYPVFMNDAVALQLKSGTNADTWQHIQNSVLQGGGIQDNPLFTGALGIYDRCILYQSDKLPNGIDSGAYVANSYRTVLAGAQAMCVAYGKDNQQNEMTYVEEEHDYGNELGCSIGSIYGMKKARYTAVDSSQGLDATTAKDHAVLTVTSYAPAIAAAF